MFVSTMNLNQSSKHLDFIVQKATEFYNGIETGTDFYTAYKHIFFDIIAKIIFGENVF